MLAEPTGGIGAVAGGEGFGNSTRRHHCAFETRGRRIWPPADERLHAGGGGDCEEGGGSRQAVVDARGRFPSRPLPSGGISFLERRVGCFWENGWLEKLFRDVWRGRAGRSFGQY